MDAEQSAQATDEAEITPEMLSAGLRAFSEFGVTAIYNGDVSDQEVVTSVYRAMQKARSETPAAQR